MKLLIYSFLALFTLSLEAYGSYKGSFNNYQGYRAPVKAKSVDLLEKSVKNVSYTGKPTYFFGKITKETIENSQNTDGFSGNCVFFCTQIAKKARELGLNYEYQQEYQHLVIIVQYKTGEKYRYSNGKRTYRTY